MAKRRRRRKRRKIDPGIIFLAFMFCIVIAAATILIMVKVVSHKGDYFDEGLRYYEAGKYEDALSSFLAAYEEKQIFSQNKDKNTLLYIADIYMKIGKYDLAVDSYDKVLTYSSVDTDSVRKMKSVAEGLYDFSVGNYAGALPVLEEYVKDYPELYMYIGTCYSSMEDTDNMFKAYEKYIDRYGYNSYLYAQYAAYYISIGKYDDAYGYINNGLTSDECFNPYLRLQEITYYEKLYEYDKAYELAKELYELYPDFEEGVNEYYFLDTRVSHEE